MVDAKRSPMMASAKQSIVSRKERMDCFVAGAPRNDVPDKPAHPFFPFWRDRILAAIQPLRRS